MPVVSIRHLTTYRYRKPVGFGEHRMMLRPLESHDQRLLSADLEIGPEPSVLRDIHDVSGSTVTVARFATASDVLTFESRVRVDHRPPEPFDLEDSDAVLSPAVPFAYGPEEAADLAASMLRRPFDGRGEVEAWAQRFVSPRGGPPSRALRQMSQAIREEFAYAIRLEGPPKAPAQTLAERRGACRDFALLMMDAARSLGLAARFVSGYVYSPAGSDHRGGGHTHAWTRVYLPGAGWTDFDPTNGAAGSAGLIRTTAVADPRLAVPLQGTWTGAAADYVGLDVDVEVTPETAPASPPRLRIASAG